MQALVDYERKVHPVCGLHDSIAKTDPYITLEDDVCPACRAIEVQMRVRAEDEREADEEAGASEPHAGDGRTTFVRLLSPVEVAAMRSEGAAPDRR